MIAVKTLREWRANPQKFVYDNFKVNPDAWQQDLLAAMGDPKKTRIAMKAAKGPGKTAGLAWCIWNFLACYAERGEHPKGAAVAITEDNLKDNLWPELAKWQARSPFLKEAFTWQKERISAKAHPETWFFSARSWPKSADITQQSNTLAGLHSEYLMFVLDESGGIPDAVMAAAEGGLATGKWAKILQAGNPTHRAGPLYRACTQERHLWHVITITGDPDDPARSPRISVQWAKEQIEKYGRENPWVMVNVFGEFPPDSLNSLLGPEEVEKAMNRAVKHDDYAYSQKRLGVDVARFGDDRTVIFPRQGLLSFKPVELRNARTNDIASRVILGKSRWNSEVEFIDDTGGYGAGVVDSMLQAGHAPIPINFAGKADDPKYFNKRAEMWFRMANWIKRGGSLPKMPELIAELTAPTYTFASGKFRIEEKKQIKERLGSSPDYADALALTFAHEEMPGQQIEGLNIVMNSHPQHLSDYDPFEEKEVNVPRGE